MKNAGKRGKRSGKNKGTAQIRISEIKVSSAQSYNQMLFGGGSKPSSPVQNYLPGFNTSWLNPAPSARPTSGGSRRPGSSGGAPAASSFDYAAYQAELERIRIANLTSRYVHPFSKPTAVARGSSDLLLEMSQNPFYEYSLRNNPSPIFGGSSAIMQNDLSRVYGLSASTMPLGQTVTGGQKSGAPYLTPLKDYMQEKNQHWYNDTNVTSLVTTASISAGVLLQGTNSSVGLAVAAATRAPHFNSLGNGLVSVSDSVFYQGGSGGLRVAAESTLMNGDDMVSAAFRSQRTFNSVSKALNTVGNAIAVGAIAFDVGSGIAENVENGASTEQIVGDATGDLVVSGGTAVVTTFTSVAIPKMLVGFFAGSVAPGIGNLVGAIGGLIVGVVSFLALDYITYENGKTGRENIQDWITDAIIWAENNTPTEALNSGGRFSLSPVS